MQPPNSSFEKATITVQTKYRRGNRSDPYLSSGQSNCEYSRNTPKDRSRIIHLRSYVTTAVLLLVFCGIVKCDQHGQQRRPRNQYTTEEFISTVCSPPLQSTTRVAPVLCTLEQVSKVVFCALAQLVRVEVANCRGVDIRTQPGKYIGCLIILHSAFHTFREVHKDAQGKPVTYPNCTAPSVFELARDTAEQCGLFLPNLIHNHPEICYTTMHKNSSRTGRFSRFGHIEASMLARVSLTILSRPGESLFRRTSAIEPGCWEPDILRTLQLYRRKDVWDVSDSCIDVLRVALLKIYALAPSLLAGRTRFNVCSSSGHDFAMYGKTSLEYALCAYVWLKHRQMLGMNIPRWISRFSSIAKHRRNKAVASAKTASTPPVSCGKLRGKAKDVREALVTLLRLVLLARTERRGFQLAYVLPMLFLSNYLPCFVRQIV